MALKPTRLTRAKVEEAREIVAAASDSRGLTRVYIDLPRHLSVELGVMAARRQISKRALLAELVEQAINPPATNR